MRLARMVKPPAGSRSKRGEVEYVNLTPRKDGNFDVEGGGIVDPDGKAVGEAKATPVTPAPTGDGGKGKGEGKGSELPKLKAKDLAKLDLEGLRKLARERGINFNARWKEPGLTKALLGG